MTREDKCSLCAKSLALGEFTYDQSICWDCFELDIRQAVKILNNARCSPSLDMLYGHETLTRYSNEVEHMLLCMAEMHRQGPYARK